MLTDTHCHLIAPQWQQSLSSILERAKANQVTQLIVPSAFAAQWPAVLALRQPEIRARACGIHPWFVSSEWSNELCSLHQIVRQESAVWIGEIGLDKSKIAFEHKWFNQLACFEAQLELAKETARPIILHTVRATDEVLASLKRTAFSLGGIAHGFSGSLEEANQLIKKGFLIGLGSLLLNMRAKKVRELAFRLPENSFVLETDSPYMLPENRNEPANLLLIAKEVAQLRGMTLPQLAQVCEKNLSKLC